MEIFKLAHPGERLREEMGETITVTALAKQLDVTRAHLSMILNGRAGISSLMSLKLDEAFGKPEGFWAKLQYEYDLAQARKIKAKHTAIASLKSGKSSDPNWGAVKIYLHKQTHKKARRKWEDANRGDFSDLVQDLLTQYLEN
jgi:antitoxin HigA-1